MERYSITFTGEPEMYSHVLSWIEAYSDNVSSTVLVDTQKIYDDSEHFRALVKAEKKAKQARMQFVNDYNPKK